jgi:hypothetical protein
LGFNREPVESTHFGTILVEGSFRTNVFDPPDEERLQISIVEPISFPTRNLL